ncbi:MAG: type II 3-dehydroquinate dehydratase [Alcaligenaceae bacterium]|nr:type II 3-dehydroquinate dehydratase [Alcaligenaceae bacterium]
MTRNLLIINGPNLNLLGTREPEIYGSHTLGDINRELAETAAGLDVCCEFYQSNHEGDLVDRIQQAMANIDFIIINAGAYTHTSVAIRDALAGVNIPFIEVHISNVHQREAFRHHSYLSDKAVAVICGLGAYGYTAAMYYAAKHYFK